jgi:hypothetical protein
VTEFSPSGNSLVFSTYLGGSNDEEGNGITLDPSGNIWVTGYTKSSDFPVVSPIQAAKGGSADAFISELAPAGTSLLFSTFIGGSKDDLGMAITSDSVGNIYATGYTESLNFPTVAPMQPANAGYRDLFALKIGSAPLPTGLAPPTLTDVPANHSSANVSFSFTHPTPGVTFQCGIDGGAPVDCTSPAVYSGLADGPHVFRVTAFGTGGASSPATEYSWDVGIDSTPPTVSITLVADTLGTNTTNTVNYSGTDDHAIDHFDVYSRYGLGGSQTLVQSSPLQKYTATGLAPGTYCYQVTAFDAAGNSATSAERCTDVPFDDRDASISYSGATLQIASAGAYSGTITRLSGAGQSAQVSCVCRKFGFLIQKSPSSGKVKVYIDGQLAATVDLYSVGVLNSQLAVKSTFPLGPHTLQLVWSGTKSASSSGFDVNVDGISTIA